MKECEIILRSSRRDKTDKIPKRKHECISLFERWKDRTPISIADWGGNCACDDDTEENDEVIGNDFDIDGLAVAI